MEFRTGTISFGRFSGSGPRTASQDITFDKDVQQATAILRGTDFGFSPPDDHHLGMVTIGLEPTILGNIVRVTATFGVRDWSDNWDDDYEGNVHFTLLAELV